MTTNIPAIPSDPATLQQGFESSRQAFQQRFSGQRWLLGNLSEEKRRDIYVVMNYLSKCLELLSEQPTGLIPGTHWESTRDELRHAVLDKGQDPLSNTIVEVANRKSIAKQWLFDILDGIDLWTRFRKFQTYDELAHFACKVGGGAFNLMIPIIEFENPNYEAKAAATGQAIALTQILLGYKADFDQGRCLLPADMLKQFGLTSTEIQSDEQQHAFCRFVRALAVRIELEFYEAAPILRFLSFDGQRVLKSLFAWHWELLTKIKQDPLRLLTHSIELSRGEMAKLRLKHLLGTEGAGVPFVAAGLAQNGHNHAN